MRKLFGTTLLITALTCSSYAGVIQNPGPDNPPNSEPGVMQTGSPGEGSTDGLMPNGADAASDSQAIEITLGLLQSILPALF